MRNCPHPLFLSAMSSVCNFRQLRATGKGKRVAGTGIDSCLCGMIEWGQINSSAFSVSHRMTHMKPTEVITVLLLIVLCICAVSDLRAHRIPNSMICSGALLCLSYQILSDGLSGLYSFMLGLLIPFFFFFILYRMHVIGAGDTKLFSVIGSYWGLRESIPVFFVILVCGAFYSLGVLLYHRQFRKRVKHLFNHIRSDLLMRTISPYDSSIQETSLYVPLAVPSLIGMVFMVYGRTYLF